MSRKRPSPERTLRLPLWMAGLLVCGVCAAQAVDVVLHLRNGDRIAGTIVSEDTNRIVLATSWIKELPVPVSAILTRELVTNAAATVAVVEQPAAPATPKPEPPKPTTSPPPAAPAAETNVAAAAKPAVPVAALAPPPKAPKPKLWKAEMSLGTDTQFGAHDHQLYAGRLKWTYEKPYKSNPKKYFRSIFDYAVDYGKTDGVKSADRMYGGLKTDFDVGPRVFVYNMAGVGYDDIRKIDLGYEAGPGVGYHLFTLSNFVMNVEGGLNYQVQKRSGSEDVESFYFRLAEDFTWKITPRLTLVEKAEVFPRTENAEQFRARLSSTLSFPLWKNISFNLSVLDLYDTNPADGVDKNEIQVRSLLGITF